MALVRVIYVHNHDCPKEGQEVVNHSRTSDHEIVRFYFSDADPVAECGCGWRAVGDSAVDAFKAWWRHSMAATEDEVPA